MPYREIPDSQVQAARQLLRAHPEPLYRSDAPAAVAWDWCYALSLVDLVEMIDEQPTCPVEVQALRVGWLLLACLVSLLSKPNWKSGVTPPRRALSVFTWPTERSGIFRRRRPSTGVGTKLALLTGRSWARRPLIRSHVRQQSCWKSCL